jgi:hypothetical protein
MTQAVENQTLEPLKRFRTAPDRIERRLELIDG